MVWKELDPVPIVQVRRVIHIFPVDLRHNPEVERAALGAAGSGTGVNAVVAREVTKFRLAHRHTVQAQCAAVHGDHGSTSLARSAADHQQSWKNDQQSQKQRREVCDGAQGDPHIWSRAHAHLH